MNFDPDFDLGNLDGTNGFTISGTVLGDDFGESLSSAGDFNGDGITDLIIGSTGLISPGNSYVIFGGSDVAQSGSFDIATLDGRDGFVVNGAAALDALGQSVSSAGDVNNDGFDDLIIGTPGADRGQAQILFGGDRSNFFDGSLNIADLDTSDGITIASSTRLGEAFGASVSGLGDINADGIDDFIVGAPDAFSGRGFDGRSYVIFGDSEIADGRFDEELVLDGSNGFVLEGISGLLNGSGSEVSDAGDVNNDGINDILIGASNLGAGSGEAYVVFGGADIGGDGQRFLADLDGQNGFRIPGDRGNQLGRSLSSAGDVNNDGIDDFIVGVPRPTNGGATPTGESYVVFGTSGLGDTGTLDLDQLDGSNGFKVQGEDNFSQFGSSVSGAGDVNNDGIDDLLFGSVFSPSGYVLYGGEDVGNSGLINVADLDGDNGFRLFEQFKNAGKQVSNLGDFNNDGIDDFVVADPDDQTRGKVYIVYGQGETIDPPAEPTLRVEKRVDANGDGVFSREETAGDDSSRAVFQVEVVNTGDVALTISDVADSAFDNATTQLDQLVGQTLAVGESTLVTYEATLPEISATTVGTADVDTLLGQQVTSTSEVSISATTARNRSATASGAAVVVVDANDVIAGGLGADTIRGWGGDDILRGDGNLRGSQVGIGNDDVIFGGAGDDRIGGKGGNDTLFGESGDDRIWGDDGDDILRGGLGNDTLTGDDFSGGAGIDTFVLAAGEGTDTIVDFQQGIDLIGLADGLTFGSLSLRGNAIAFGEETLAILQGTDTTTLSETDFVTMTV